MQFSWKTLFSSPLWTLLSTPPRPLPALHVSFCIQKHILHETHSGHTVRTGTSHTSWNKIQLLRCMPHQSEEQRHASCTKDQTNQKKANSQFGLRLLTKTEAMPANKNSGHKDKKTREETETKKQNINPTKTNS